MNPYSQLTSDATLASLSPTSSILDKTAAITSVGEQLTSITAALKDSATSIKAATPGCSSKRSALALTTTDLTITSPHPEKRQIVAVGVLLALIIVEIFATITAAIAVLGLAGLLLFINPLTGALAVLILAVEVLVDALLIAVIVLLDTLLTGLAIGIGGL
jgi:hypothetical protein